MPLDIEHLRTWIGRSEATHDMAGAAPVCAMSETLDRDDPTPQPGDALPACRHWLDLLPARRRSELAADGHANRGGFLLPMPLARRFEGTRT